VTVTVATIAAGSAVSAEGVPSEIEGSAASATAPGIGGAAVTATAVATGSTCRASVGPAGGAFGAGDFRVITGDLFSPDGADARPDFTLGSVPVVIADGVGRAFCTVSVSAISALGDRVGTTTLGFLLRDAGGIWIFFRTTAGFASAIAWLSQVPAAVTRKDNMVSEMMPRSVFIADRFCFFLKRVIFSSLTSFSSLPACSR
jgi:hypothetical protein